MPAIHLTYRGLCIRVVGPDAAELSWLAEFLAPAFAGGGATSAACEVLVAEDAARLEVLRAAIGDDAAPAICLVQDTGPVSLPARRNAAGAMVRHDAAELVYVVDSNRRRIELVATRGGHQRRTALMKVVRELAMSAAWSRDSLILHAAACVAGDQAILIAGPKRAGKSSLLLHALGARDVRLLANDRIVFALEGPRGVASGMPTIVNLRPDTVLARFPHEADRRAAHRFRFSLTVAEAARLPAVADLTPRNLSCSPPQLAHLLGVQLIGQARATVLLLPRVDASAHGITVRRLGGDEAAARLPDVLFASRPGPRISDVFALSDHGQTPTAEELARLWRASLERLRVFECRLGPDAYNTDAADLLARVIQ